MSGAVDDLRLRREALQIAMQLPADKAEALRLLALVEELVLGFLSGPENVGPPAPVRPLFRVV